NLLNSNDSTDTKHNDTGVPPAYRLMQAGPVWPCTLSAILLTTAPDAKASGPARPTFSRPLETGTQPAADPRKVAVRAGEPGSAPRLGIFLAAHLRIDQHAGNGCEGRPLRDLRQRSDSHRPAVADIAGED